MPNKYLEDVLPFLIAALTGIYSYVETDPRYVIYGVALAIVIKTLTSLLSKPPVVTTPPTA